MLNVNVGLLGHVDSGKTSLAKALSETASTAAFDKSPQSQARGITLDLGFSACELTPESPGCHDVLAEAGVEKLMCTLVDCPGHASLIRTVVGGAQIIDVMILLIDATKGFQLQTAECLVLGEVLARPLVVVVNKVDAVQGTTPEAKRQALDKLRKRLEATFAKTRWPRVPIIEVSASPRSDSGETVVPYHTEKIMPTVLQLVNLPELVRTRSGLSDHDVGRFRMLVDHCFAVRGQGTVFTGTVLAGAIRIGESILIPDQRVVKKVKGLQVFHKPVEEARRGDRVGLCVAQYDAKQMERGILYQANTENDREGPIDSHQGTDVLIAEVHRVRFHTLPCDPHTNFHVTIGHATVMATMRFFSRSCAGGAAEAACEDPSVPLDLTVESLYEEALGEDSFSSYVSSEATPVGKPLPLAAGSPNGRRYFAVLLLDRRVFVSVGDMFIAMRLDIDRENICRIAMAGHVRALMPPNSATGDTPSWRSLPVVRIKEKVLSVDRVIDAMTCIAVGVVSLNQEVGTVKGKEQERTKAVLHAEVQKFVGLQVRFVPDESGGNHEGSVEHDGPRPGDVTGLVDSTFGKTGKVKLIFKAPVFAPLAKEKATRSECPFLVPGTITLHLKKYPFAHFNHIQQ